MASGTLAHIYTGMGQRLNFSWKKLAIKNESEQRCVDRGGFYGRAGSERGSVAVEKRCTSVQSQSIATCHMNASRK